MISSALKGALIGTLFGPLWAVLTFAYGNSKDQKKEIYGETVPNNDNALIFVAVLNTLIFAGALSMALLCTKTIRWSEIGWSVFLTVPYVAYRAIFPCVKQYPLY
ncbi:hypothetical protein TetV_255 [Tetraselmis virus 1]|uniref:Uncharacterized protein n=1 Tax=Tetraselmis virus 1 TaxID=2060617 RepID=A0A2P0VN54_9VIRU|nr:hypothetical protein QJ968_gp255 [Tetraselmis virus 1]AUF82347.1 hypothetical protein TetV_255 [Tetraselmis virus 1]